MLVNFSSSEMKVSHITHRDMLIEEGENIITNKCIFND